MVIHYTKMNIFIKLSVIIFVLHGIEGSDWNYKNQKDWPLMYPSCGLKQQSPINVNTEKAISKKMPPLTFHNYSSTCKVEIINNCHTAEIRPLPSCAGQHQISGGPLTGKYTLLQLHFHWKAEHTINGKRFALGVHLVHTNAKGQIAVIGFFFEANLLNYYSGLNNVTHQLSKIRKCNTTSTIENLNLLKLINGKVKDKFYTYDGSLTTPPCAEGVKWIVFPNTIKINPLLELLSFRTLLDQHGEAIESNFRNLQSVGERKIYYRD